MKRTFLVIVLNVTICVTGIFPQLLTDTVSLGLVRQYVKNTYNLNFDEADKIYSQIYYMYPDHPAIHMLSGMEIYWRNFPLEKNSQTATVFRREMEKCIKECESSHKRDDPEILLTNLCARGLLLQFFSDNNDSRSVIPLAAGTYKYIQMAFENEESFGDFSFFTGLYNYYREAYPEKYPVYKALAFMFPRGDKVSGLKQLDKASAGSVFLKAEASSFLAYIYYGFEKSLKESERYNRRLSSQYPENPLFRTNLIKVLVLQGKYTEAEQLIERTDSDFKSNKYFMATLTIMRGVISEKKYLNHSDAEKLYLTGIKDVENSGPIGDEYCSYAWLGLSRIYLRQNDEKRARTCRKNAIALNPSIDLIPDFN